MIRLVANLLPVLPLAAMVVSMLFYREQPALAKVLARLPGRPDR